MSNKTFTDRPTIENMKKLQTGSVNYLQPSVARLLSTNTKRESAPSFSPTFNIDYVSTVKIGFRKSNKTDASGASGGSGVFDYRTEADASDQPGVNINNSNLRNMRQGKDIKNIAQFLDTSIPTLTINNNFKKRITEKGKFNHNATSFSYGMNTFSSIGVRKKTQLVSQQNPLKTIPFNDVYRDRLSPVEYVEKGEYIFFYPIVTDNTVDLLYYNDPDDIAGAGDTQGAGDGIIDVFEIRRELANTETYDIKPYGIKGGFNAGGFRGYDYSPSILTSKGSSKLMNKFEYRTSKNDYFEDSEELLFTELNFGEVRLGIATGSNKGPVKFCLDGFVSDGIYESSPFDDGNSTAVQKIKSARNFFNDNNVSVERYNILSGTLQHERNASSIGTYFKSSNCGFILRPKYEYINQNVPGTDSIAFSGLLKE